MNIVCVAVDTPDGRISAASCGHGFPVLLLHQTPRSWDEYRDVLPILGRHYNAIAMDTVGYGASPPYTDGRPSIERWAQSALALMDALGFDRFAVVGHHTGAVIGVEMAASRPERVAALVLSSCPMVDADKRARHGRHAVVDDVVKKADGSHLLELWKLRQPFYPPGDIDLLERFIIDALRAGDRAAAGHLVVNQFVMEDRIGLVRCPTLIIGATDDPHAFPAVPRLAQALPHAVTDDIAGGMVPLPDQLPAEFAGVVDRFLGKSLTT